VGVRLRSILTSSHIRRPRRTDVHGVFKRPHSISVFVDRLALSANHRRLRFSFQINDVKDLTSELAPPDYARVAARSGVSSRRSRSCQPAQMAPPIISSVGFL
jgi:hypothetical protein